MRQLRLRDIGGIIVIDFIDMAYTRNRDQVLNVLRKALEEDRTRTYVVEISPLGLVEMTRQNVTEGVREIMNKPCPTCEGEGVVLLGGDDRDRRRAQAARARQGVEVGGLPGPGAPAGRRDPDRRRRQAAPGARGGDRQALPLPGQRGQPARHLRDHRRGHPRGDRAPRAAVQQGRGGPDRDRGAAHVQRGRRDRQDRRLRDLDRGRRPVRRREEAGPDQRGQAHGRLREPGQRQRRAATERP